LKDVALKLHFYRVKHWKLLGHIPVALIHSISITDFFFMNSVTVFPSVPINFSHCEPFSAWQKGWNQRRLSQERLLANQEWRLGPLEISDSGEAPRGFWYRICMTSFRRYVSDSGRRCIGSRDASVCDRADPSGFFSLHPFSGICMHTFLYELRLGISTLSIIVGNRAKWTISAISLFRLIFCLKSNGEENHEIRKFSMLKILKRLAIDACTIEAYAWIRIYIISGYQERRV